MNLWTGMLDLLFPPKCPFCRMVLDEPRAPVCPDCQEKLPWLIGERGKRRVNFTKGCVSPLRYRDSVREAIQHYKFTPNPAYGEPFGMLMTQCVQDHPEIGSDLITWAPLSRKRRWKRGFDQAELLARTIGRELGIPVLPTLNKIRDTPPQSGLEEDAARRANAMGAYELRQGETISGKRILLVDDVVTSGSTL